MSAASAYKSDTDALARGAVINFLGNFGRISRAISLLLVAWLFGAETLGLYVLAWATTDFLRRFVSFGQEAGVVYFLGHALADGDEKEGARVVASSLLIVLVTSAVGSLALWFGMGFISERLLNEPRLVTAFRAFAFVLPAVGLTSVFLASTRARRVMKYDVLCRSVIEPFALLLGTVLAWLMGTGLFGLAMAQTVALWVSALASLMFYRSLFPLRALPHSLFGRTEIRRLVRYAAPLAAKDIVGQGVARIDLFLVGRFLDATAAGIYGIVVEVASLSRYVRQALEPIFAPIIVELNHSADRGRLKHTYGNATRWALIVNLAIFGVAVLAGGTILHVYGSAFAAGGAALAVLVAGQVVNGAFGLSEMMLLMSGRPALMLGNMTVLLVLIGMLDYAFIGLWGLTGAAIGTASATVIVIAVQVVQVRASTGVHPLAKGLMKPVIACFSALFLAWVIPLWHLPAGGDHILRAILFVASYLVLLLQFGLEEEERRAQNWMKARLGRRVASTAARR